MLHDVEMNLKSTTTNPFNNSLRWGTEQPGSSFGLIFFLFPTKIAGGHAHSSRGKSLVPDP